MLVDAQTVPQLLQEKLEPRRSLKEAQRREKCHRVEVKPPLASDEIENEYFRGLYSYEDLGISVKTQCQETKGFQLEQKFYQRIFDGWTEQDSRVEKRAESAGVLHKAVGGLSWAICFLVFNIACRIFSKETLEFSNEERKQDIVIIGFLSLIPLISVAAYWSVAFIIFPLTTIPMVMYLFFVFKRDQSPVSGKRIPFLRYSTVWRHFVNYFPIRLVKTYDLPRDGNFVMCYHPHGIISFGAFGNFATDATGFSSLFPGVDIRLLTLGMNFFVPFLREFLLAMGICACSREACDGILSRKQESSNGSSKPAGNAVMLVVGGAQESLEAKPRTCRLTLRERKGFVRVALVNNAQLVPVLGFGENDVYSTAVFGENSWARWLQNIFKKSFGFATPYFWGRTVRDQRKAGLMPHKMPIIAVVGKPLPAPSLPKGVTRSMVTYEFLKSDPSGMEMVDKYHRFYIKALTQLYQSYKGRWACNRSESLRIDERIVPGNRAMSMKKA